MFNKVLLGTAVICFLLAAVVRMQNLDSVPAGLNWDETAYAYNAYSIWQTGADEWNVPYPFLLRSFGENKPALLSYILIPFFAIFGPTTFTARFVAALLGMIGVAATFGIVYRLNRSITIATITSLLLAFTPWHLYHSRAVMDPIAGHGLLLAGYLLWLHPKKPVHAVGALILGLSMYAYNAERVFVPLFVTVSFFLLYKNSFKKELRARWIGYCCFVALATFAVFQTLFSSAGDRSRVVSIFSESFLTEQKAEKAEMLQGSNPLLIELHTSTPIVLMQTFAKNYSQHFRPDFLFFSGGNLANLSFSKYGNLLSILLPFFVIGLAVAVRNPKRAQTVFLAWLVLAPIPSALTQDVPHAGRALLMLPAVQYFAALGIEACVTWKKHWAWQWITGIGISLGIVYAVIIFLSAFWSEFPKESYHGFQGYNPELAQLITQKSAQYSSIFITNSYDHHSVLFYAWYSKLDPSLVQLGRREYYSLIQAGNIARVSNQTEVACSLLQTNALVVLTPSQAQLLTSASLQVMPFKFDTNNTAGFVFYDTKYLNEQDRELANKICSRSMVQDI